MKAMKENATILTVERLKNTIWGNPRWLVVFKEDNGVTRIGKTANDSMASYQIDTYSVDRRYEITYHITDKFNLYIDFLKEI